MKRLLVTGAGGFVGAWVLRQFSATPAWGYVPVAFGPTDVRNADAVRTAIEVARPDAVLHLAAQSFVPRSFEAPRETLEINLFGTLNLLESLRATGFAGRFLYVSSGDVYGLVPSEHLPVDERHVPAPRNPYALSKFAAEQLCLQWHRSEGLDVVIARPFNHIGPGQSPRFVVPSLARQVRLAARHHGPKVLDAGDIETSRDFLDVRDVVAAYAALLAHGRTGETYLVASGIERRIRDLLDLMCRLEQVNVDVRVDPARLRPTEQRRMIADAGKLRQHTGWHPAVTIEQSLRDILDDSEEEET